MTFDEWSKLKISDCIIHTSSREIHIIENIDNDFSNIYMITKTLTKEKSFCADFSSYEKYNLTPFDKIKFL